MLGLTVWQAHSPSPLPASTPINHENQIEVGETVALPVRLRIPVIDLDAEFTTPLGLTITQEVEVPAEDEKVGWYKFGPRPGALGPAVILGHVDSYQGPAVFFSLGQLTVGEQIMIDREDGSTATFVVTAVERYSQDDFPTTLVYGDIDYPGLRLITCSGRYDRLSERYTHNLVVYARLADV